MTKYQREDVKGNLLKLVVTRLDYKDLFELSRGTLKKISEICTDNELTERDYRMLDDEDFENNDRRGFIHIPYEYLTDIESFLFNNNSNDLTVEINQLFLKVSLKVEDEYNGYDPIMNLIKDIVKVLDENEELSIKRIGIKKVNQIFVKNYKDLRKYLKEDLLNFNQFKEMIDWESENSKIFAVENFSLNDVNVNFVKLFDNGLINGEKYYRFYFEYETFINENMNDIVDDLKRLNENIFTLFTLSLREEALEMLKNNEGIGETI